MALTVLFGAGCSMEPRAEAVMPRTSQANPDTLARGASSPPSAVDQKKTICADSLCLYTNKENGFSLQYPESWQVREGAFGTIVSILSPLDGTKDQFSENVNVVSEAVSANTNLNDYYKASEANLKKYFTDFKVLKNDGATLGGYPARTVTYQAAQASLKLRTTQVFTIRDNRVFIITLTNVQDSPNNYFATMSAVVRSFRFLK